MLAQAAERGLPFSGVVWRSVGPNGQESSTEVRGADRDRDRQPAQRRAHRARRSQNGSVKLPGGLWIVTERAVATESCEPVDPLQAALWGFGRTTISEEPALRCQTRRPRWIAGSGSDAGQAAGHAGRRAGTRCAPRQAAGLPVVAVGAQRSSHGAALIRLRPRAHRTRCDRQPAFDRGGRAAAGRGLRTGPSGGRGPQLPGCAQRPRPLPGRPRADRRGLRRRRHTVG